MARKRPTTWTGARLRQLREAAGLTQRELGERIGVIFQAVARLEAGTAPAWDTAVRLADALGVSLDELRDDRPAG